jgi:class 3 adenylate cyclase
MQFLEAVHDRLFADKSEEMAWKNDEPEQRALKKAFLDGKKPTKKGKPSADQFDSVTVLFADLAGFTKWNSSRKPEQVFELLMDETL